MNVLGICGSHRKGGATEFFLSKALSACEREGLETELVTLHDKEIKPCVVCNYCKTHPECATKDDLLDIHLKMTEADALVIASPTYFASVSGKMKDFFDRSLQLRRNGFKLRNKPGGAIAVGASRNGGQELVCQQIHNWMLLHEMLVVADEKTAHFGGIAWAPRGQEPGDDKLGIDTCENLGRRIAQVLKLTRRVE